MCCKACVCVALVWESLSMRGAWVECLLRVPDRTFQSCSFARYCSCSRCPVQSDSRKDACVQVDGYALGLLLLVVRQTLKLVRLPPQCTMVCAQYQNSSLSSTYLL